MILNELKKEVEKDAKINPLELDIESLKISDLANKYLQMRADENILLRQYERKYKELYRIKWEYYTGKASDEIYKEKPFPLKILKPDLNIYLESDLELNNLQDKLIVKKEKIRYIDGIIGILNSRSFNITNAIRWQEFINGGK